MVKLIILKGDGSHYWTEQFPTQEEADSWLAEEKTRINWKDDRTWTFEEIIVPIPVLSYQQKRREEYPSMGDQLDAIYKKLSLGESADYDAIAVKIDNVKKKYPKPE